MMDLIGGIRNAVAGVQDVNKKKKRKDKKKKVKRKPKEPIEYPTPVKMPKRRPGRLYTFGNNDCGQLGFQNVTEIPVPTLVGSFQNKTIKMVACGAKHTLVLDTDGLVWSFGSNQEKALGRETLTKEEELTPTPVEILEKVKQISAGDSHSAALTDNGNVYAWGCYKNQNGQPMGIDSYLPEEDDAEYCDMPYVISDNLKEEAEAEDVRIIKIVSGAHHIVMLGDDSRLYTCGAWDVGQLGRQQADLKRVTRNLGEVDEGHPMSDREYHLKPGLAFVGNKYDVRNIWAGQYATFCFAGKTGYIYVAGDNTFCQLGIPIIRNNYKNTTYIWCMTKSNSFNAGDFQAVRWRQFVGGKQHTLALTETGQVYVLGNPASGRLGIPRPEIIGANVGTVPLHVEYLTTQTCIQLAAGNESSYALTLDNKLYCWGFGGGHLSNKTGDNAVVSPQLCQGMDKLEKEGLEIVKLEVGGEHAALLMYRKESIAN